MQFILSACPLSSSNYLLNSCHVPFPVWIIIRAVNGHHCDMVPHVLNGYKCLFVQLDFIWIWLEKKGCIKSVLESNQLKLYGAWTLELTTLVCHPASWGQTQLYVMSVIIFVRSCDQNSPRHSGSELTQHITFIYRHTLTHTEIT